MCIDIEQIWFLTVNAGIFLQFLTELSACDRSDFSFWDDNLSKYMYQWVFIKLGMCIDIVEIWFGIAKWQISSIFDRASRKHAYIILTPLNPTFV